MGTLRPSHSCCTLVSRQLVVDLSWWPRGPRSSGVPGSLSSCFTHFSFVAYGTLWSLRAGEPVQAWPPISSFTALLPLHPWKTSLTREARYTRGTLSSLRSCSTGRPIGKESTGTLHVVKSNSPTTGGSWEPGGPHRSHWSRQTGQSAVSCLARQARLSYGTLLSDWSWETQLARISLFSLRTLYSRHAICTRDSRQTRLTRCSICSWGSEGP